MMSIKDVVNAALVDYIKRKADPHASVMLKVYEEIEHALLTERYNYGAEDVYIVKMIYRTLERSIATYYYEGTFGQLLREIVDYEDRQEIEQRSKNAS